jgi:hypothetical protein
MYVNILMVIFSIAFIALAIFAVYQMVSKSRKPGSKK